MHLAKKGLLVAAAASGALASLSAGAAYADSGAQGAATGSPGVLSGNNIQVPVNVPVNVCGNTVNVVGLLNPAIGNNCANVSHTAPPTEHRPPHKPEPAKPHPSETPRHHTPSTPSSPAPQVQAASSGGGGSTLAETGSDVGIIAPVGAALLLGGFVLYRRTRPTS